MKEGGLLPQGDTPVPLEAGNAPAPYSDGEGAVGVVGEGTRDVAEVEVGVVSARMVTAAAVGVVVAADLPARYMASSAPAPEAAYGAGVDLAYAVTPPPEAHHPHHLLGCTGVVVAHTVREARGVPTQGVVVVAVAPARVGVWA